MLSVTVMTDADQGLGTEIIKVLSKKFGGVTYFTSRDVNKGKTIVADLNRSGLNLEYHQLDISDKESITRFRDHMQQNCGGIDCLINNVAIGNGVQLCDTYEKSAKVVNDYYFNFVMVQDLLFPILRDHSRVLYVSKPGDLSCIRDEYWLERLSMKHLKQSDINDFLQWYLDSIKNGANSQKDIAEDGTLNPYRVTQVALGLLTMLQRKQLKPRHIIVDYMYPTWSLGNPYLIIS